MATKRKYLDREPRIGDTVEVGSWGLLYSTYGAWAEAYGLTKWKRDPAENISIIARDDMFRVVAIGGHLSYKDSICLGLYSDKYDTQFIVGRTAIRVVESISEKLDLI